MHWNIFVAASGVSPTGFHDFAAFVRDRYGFSPLIFGEIFADADISVAATTTRLLKLTARAHYIANAERDDGGVQFPASYSASLEPHPQSRSQAPAGAARPHLSTTVADGVTSDELTAIKFGRSDP